MAGLARAVALLACGLPLATCTAYHVHWNSYAQKMVDGAFAGRQSIYSSDAIALSDVGEEGKPWFTSNANATTDGATGLLRLSVRTDTRGASAGGAAVYGTMWLRQRLPLDGVAVEWTFMFPEPANAHDMNWWFPTQNASNDVYTSEGKSDPFYVWGFNGWGGRLTGMERSDGGSSLAAAAAPTPGTVYNALYYSRGGKQFLFLDGQLVSASEDRAPIQATDGFFAFSVFQSAVEIGAVRIFRLTGTSA